MGLFQLDLPSWSTITIFVPHDEVIRTRTLLNELISDPRLKAGYTMICVEGSTQPSKAAEQCAGNIELNADGAAETRVCVGLADELRPIAWSVCYSNSKYMLELARLVRGNSWDLDKALTNLTNYISWRIDSTVPEATLNP